MTARIALASSTSGRVISRYSHGDEYVAGQMLVGQCAETRSCPRPGCGREYPIRRYRYETLRQIGWPLFRVARFVNWCGHAQELIPVPDDAEWVRLVPVISTAK